MKKIDDSLWKIEQRKVSDLIKNDRNPRIINKETLKGVRESLYEISILGRVKNIQTGKTLKCRNTNGYSTVILCGEYKPITCYIHRLVAKAFIPNPANKQTVNHINGDKSDNRVENLEWATQKENIHHALRTGLSDSGIKPIKCIETGIIYKSLREASKKLNIHETAISACCRKYIHKNGYLSNTAGGCHWQFI